MSGVQASIPIREFDPRRDLEAAYELDQRCFERGIAYTRGQIRSFLSRSGAVGLIAEDEARLAGFAIGHVAGTRGHVVTIDIAEQDRRRGLGERLLTELMRRLAAEGAQEVRLEVDLRNARAIRFYERMGFKQTRRLADYYGRGFDGLRMMRDC
jgi:ribosomal-protein-alanine N-acetyltransferase